MRHSRSTKKNPAVADWTNRYQKKNNLSFFADAYQELARKGVGNEGLGLIGLVGQRDFPGYTLRTSQAVLRWDMRPSLWSHAFFVAGKINRGNLKSVPLWESTLHPRTGKFPRPEWNGTGIANLGLYDNPQLDANVALLALRMNGEEVKKVVARAKDPNQDRARYPLWDTLGIWQGYLWSHGARPNPLREGIPIPSSSYIEYAFEAINLDLTPGASEQNSAPEHMWNAALWWHEAFNAQQRPIYGMCVLRDKGCSMMGTEE